MADEHGRGLGGWQDADLAGTARAGRGVGADAQFPRTTRFVANITKLIILRRAIDKEETDAKKVAVFLLRPGPVSCSGSQASRVPWLNNGLTPLAGRLWFVTEVATRGHYCELGDADDDSVVTLVTDELQAGSVPAIVYDPRGPAPIVRFFPLGLTSEEHETIDISSDPITEDRLAQAVDSVYRTQLATPDVQQRRVKLWSNESGAWPIIDAESRIHAQVMAGLAGSLPRCTIRHEQAGVAGRLDILVEEPHPLQVGLVTHHAVIELKVLREFRSTGSAVSDGETKKWIEEGVLQASSYRDNRSAAIAALYCFDMRKEETGETCFDHVRGAATASMVILRVWFIFTSSAAFRASRGTSS